VADGINPDFFNASSRFGRAFYAAEDPDTALAEVASHGVAGEFGVRFAFNSGAANVLDLTDPEVAAEFGYEGGGADPVAWTL
jgi:RES domain-containing protein